MAQMTRLEKAQWDLAQLQAGKRFRRDGSNTPDDARLVQGRDWDRYDSYDKRDEDHGDNREG